MPTFCAILFQVKRVPLGNHSTDNYNINIYNLFDADILCDIIPSQESAVGKPFKCSL